MWRVEFKNIVIYIVFLFYHSLICGQEFNELYRLYNERKIQELKNKLDFFEKSYPDHLEILFFKTLFIVNGDEAVSSYQQLTGQADEKLKSYLIKKISEYYYAKGYYITALEYQKKITTPSEHIGQDKIKENNNHSANEQLHVDNSSKFKIQLGAFSVKENAIQLKDMLFHNHLNAVIVERRINETRLYCIWINGKDNFESTKEYAEMIKNKFKLEYRIIKP
jgi:hypothetical protein